MRRWPDSLRLRTRRFLDGIDPFPSGDILYMKNVNCLFAYIKKEDIHNGKIILYDQETSLKTQFNSAGEMFDDGWVIDMRRTGDLRLLYLDEPCAWEKKD